MNKKSVILVAAALTATISTRAFNPPTLGWSSWNTFALNINEEVIKSQADAMVSTGLSAAGYKFINIDDGYWDGRGADGKLRLNQKLFPNGMRSLVDYIHAKGLKAGIYSDAGDNTCGSGNRHAWGLGVGFAGHEEEDCHLYFIDWDFDFIKVDYCGGGHMGLDEREQYTKISNAIKNCGKKGVVFNVCRWAYPGTWISEIADSWRTTGDINCSWGSLRAIIRENLYLQAFTGDGHYNDPDMLEIGRTLSHDEENTHMAYWCITSAPMLIGCDVAKIPQYSLDLLKNRDLLAMNQDKLGLGAPVVQRFGEVYVVAKDMKQRHGPQRAVVVTNLSDEEQTVALDLAKLDFAGKVKFYDCFSHKVVEPAAVGTYRVTVPAHGSLAYFATGVRGERQTYQAEEAWLKSYQEIKNLQTANHQHAMGADQGVFVGFLGNDAENYLEWRDVYSLTGGEYTIGIRCASAEDRGMTVQVNDGEPQEINGINTGSYISSWKTVSVKANLKKGYNRIRLSNPTAWAPNVDCMTIWKN